MSSVLCFACPFAVTVINPNLFCRVMLIFRAQSNLQPPTDFVMKRERQPPTRPSVEKGLDQVHLVGYLLSLTIRTGLFKYMNFVRTYNKSTGCSSSLELATLWIFKYDTIFKIKRRIIQRESNEYFFSISKSLAVVVF